MCGIVGYFGPSQNSVQIVLEGLRRLEYRGYDSAGVSFLNEKNVLQNYKKAGKLLETDGEGSADSVNKRIMSALR